MLSALLYLVGATSNVGVSSDGRLDDGVSSLEELAGYGMLEGAMDEVLRIQDLKLTDAVQAIVSGTSALAVSHTPDGLEMQQHIASFEAGMHGAVFFDVDDTPENARYRRALFIAACRTLANDARRKGSDAMDG